MGNIDPSQEQLQAFLAGEDDGSPIVMINLLRYRAEADYPESFDAAPCSGREAYQRYAGALLGITVAYHVTSTWLETHRRQPDLKRVGFPFAIAFIPSANLLAYGIILAFAFEGSSGVGSLISDVASVTSGWLRGLVDLVV